MPSPKKSIFRTIAKDIVGVEKGAEGLVKGTVKTVTGAVKGTVKTVKGALAGGKKKGNKPRK